jgi:hypothetical protein
MTSSTSSDRSIRSTTLVRRIRFLIALLCAPLLLNGVARATEIYWSATPVLADFEGVNVRQIAGGTLVIAPDGHAPLEGKGLTRVALPRRATPFLVRWHVPEQDRALVAGKTSFVVALNDEYAILAANDAQARQLDELGIHRERLIHIAPTAHEPRDLDARSTNKADAQTKAQIVDSVSESVITTYMRELSGDQVFVLNGILRATDNRYTHSVEHLIAADYIQDRLENMGYTVMRQEFVVAGTTTQNVIAVKTGTLYPDEIVVVGAHYDSISENPSNKAPGAEDNASGTASVMHLAEIFTGYETERTIHFIAFGGEEEGLYGSQHYVQQAGIHGDNITQSLIMDMVASWQSNYKVIIEGETPWAALMALYESNIVEFSGIGYRKDWYSWGSDHVPFQQAGIPCFLAIDWDYGDYPGYHRTTDVMASTDPSLAEEIVRALAGTLVDLTNPSPISTPVQRPVQRSAVRLTQNHPNPFNPSTVIAFELDEDARVRLDVFDPAGRHVRSLANADYSAGRHELQWSGLDDSGASVASGVYIYRLQSGDTVLSQRMVLAK